MKPTDWRPKWNKWAASNEPEWYKKGDTWLWYVLDTGEYAQVWHCREWPRRSWAITIFGSDGQTLVHERAKSKRAAIRYVRTWQG